jgi:hypothetical protein
MELLFLVRILEGAGPVETVTVADEIHFAEHVASNDLKRRAREKGIPGTVAEKVVVIETRGFVIDARGGATEREVVITVVAELEVADFVRKRGVEGISGPGHASIPDQFPLRRVANSSYFLLASIQ